MTHFLEDKIIFSKSTLYCFVRIDDRQKYTLSSQEVVNIMKRCYEYCDACWPGDQQVTIKISPTIFILSG